jgi:hypothetical protein
MSTDEFDLTMTDASRTPGRRRNNFTATASPTATDDSADGYEVGSVWIDVTNDAWWVCVDSTATAAVWIQGGGSDLEALDSASVSGSYTVDRDDAPNHHLVLTGNTVLDATSTTYTAGLISMLLFIQQDGTGGRTLDMSAFEWTDGEPVMPSGANETMAVPIFSMDDGATWIGVTGGTPALSLDDLVDVVISTPALGDALIYDGSDFVNTPISTDPADDTSAWMPLTTVVGGDPELVWDGDDSLIPTLVPL